jgi:LysM repeat protein
MKNTLKIAVLSVIVLILPSYSFATKTHKIRKNDTLYSLALKYHVSVSDLKSANNMLGKHIKPGEVLVIPSASSSGTVKEAAGKVKTKTATYKIRRGDSLERISRKTGVTVKDLQRLNGLKKGKLKPGTMLVLKESDPVVEEPKQKVVQRYSFRDTAMLADHDLVNNLTELTEFDPVKVVDLNKDLEQSLDATKRLKKTAYSFLGTRYRFGGTTRKGIDCSSFVQSVFRQLQVDLPRTAREQYWVGENVTQYDLQKGDLLFFRTYASYPSHVGIYLGDNKMIHASSRDRKVVISPITSYYRSRFIGAKRLAKINAEQLQLGDLLADNTVEVEKEEDVVRNDTLGLSLRN